MSTPARDRPADAVAGLLASAALFVGLIALVYRPVRVAPAAMLVALIAAAMSERYAKLAALALAAAAVGFAAGTTIALLAEKPLY